MNRKPILLTLLLLLLAAACRKDTTINPDNSLIPGKTDTSGILTLQQVKDWFRKQPVSNPGITMDWANAESIPRGSSNYWLVPMPGQPELNGIKQGYRKTAFLRDSTGSIISRHLDIIPDAAYFQRKGKVTTADFTGRVFIYNNNKQLLAGRIYVNGKQAGEIKPSTGEHLHTDALQLVEDCQWHDSSYTDADGVLVIYSEKICSYSSYDDGFNPTEGGGPGSFGNPPAEDPIAPQGGNGGSSPEPSNLPGEDGQKIDPKSYMDCFGTLPDIGSKMTITVYVQEPAPGLPFNVGPNSVGHTAIGLTKTYNGQSITQVVGFYPDATGKSKMHAPSRILDNSDLEYNVSIQYDVIASSFNRIASFISDPPDTYDAFSYNCTNFVVDACKTGGISLPDATGNMGLMQTGMVPGALGSSIRNIGNTGNTNTSGGTTGETHGPCN
ncbi:hypothetical protein [Mucilaginibacter sp.]|uniref:hypothetical protein n=1 Tax=Mucilaginibacter sp. TaxID=1882438 RepID=UPI003266CB50